MNLYEKLLSIQKSVDTIIKDGKNTNDKYDFASDENVLDVFRPLMDQNNLLLIPEVDDANVLEGTTRSGTARYLTELKMVMVWHDVDSGEELRVPWYAQGVDLAGEKGVGKAQTYGEKYFLLKFFHCSTKKDDPDNGRVTKSGEAKSYAASRETEEYCRTAAEQMIRELSGAKTDEEYTAAVVAVTKNDKKGYAGVRSVSELSAAGVRVLYGKMKKAYKERTGKEFEIEKENA